MTNGTMLPLKSLDDVRAWAHAHRAESAEKFHQQDGWNGKQEAWMLSQERRIQKLENRGAAMNTYAMVLGAIICAAIPIIINKLIGG